MPLTTRYMVEGAIYLLMMAIGIYGFITSVPSGRYGAWAPGLYAVMAVIFAYWLAKTALRYLEQRQGENLRPTSFALYADRLTWKPDGEIALSKIKRVQIIQTGKPMGFKTTWVVFELDGKKLEFMITYFLKQLVDEWPQSKDSRSTFAELLKKIGFEKTTEDFVLLRRTQTYTRRK